MIDDIVMCPYSYLHGQLGPSHVVASRGVPGVYMSPLTRLSGCLVTGLVSECDCHPEPERSRSRGWRLGCAGWAEACLHTPSCPTKLLRGGDDMEPLTPANRFLYTGELI